MSDYFSFGTYASPLGRICLTADAVGLTGLWFEQGRFAPFLAFGEHGDEYPAARGEESWRDTKLGHEVGAWLDLYFVGRIPDSVPPLHLAGTPFRRSVWEMLLRIPYGMTTTYGALARELALKTGHRVAAQAIGNALGHNPVALIVPCHRVVGSQGALTGYAGGIWRKAALLRLEQEK